jgi:hypothetical protein
MTTLYIRLPIVVDAADPMRCGACPAYEGPSLPGDDVGVCRNPWFISYTDDAEDDEEPMSYHYEVVDRRRHVACIAATNAAIDAEIEALKRGHDMACNDVYAEAYPLSGGGIETTVVTSFARRQMHAEVALLEVRRVRP